MKKGLIALCMVLLTACAAIDIPYIDDAYHWTRESTAKSAPATPVASTPASSAAKDEPEPLNPSALSAPASSEPAYEYVNVQDTTVTIRIKK